MYGVSLILAPLLLAISSFFWIDGEYGVVGGTILLLSVVFWMPALVFLLGLIKEKMLNYTNWGLIVAMFGFISVCYVAFAGIMSEMSDLSHRSYIEGSSRYPLSAKIVRFPSGPLAPLSLLVLGIILLRTKSVKDS